MKKNRFKKILAGLLVGLLVIGCVPESILGTVKEVNAASVVEISGLTDHNGNACTFIARHGGAEADTWKSGDASTIFDGVFSGDGNQFYVAGGSGNTVKEGDYIGLTYDEALVMETVCFTFDSDSENDRYTAAKLQYLPDGENAEWTDVEGCVYSREQTYYVELPESVQESAIKGIRLYNTGTEHGCWIRVKEIEVNANMHGLYRTSITDLHGRTGEVVVLHQGLDYANHTNTHQAGDVITLFDGKDATGVTYRGNSSGYTNDQLSEGDYVAVVYDEVIDVNSIRFVFDSSGDANRMSSATLQYTMDGTVWENIPELGNVGGEPVINVTEGQLPTGFRAKGIRVLNNTTISKWLQVYEIQINGLPTTELEVTSDNARLNVGETMQMGVVYTPEALAGAGVTWSVKNEIGEETTFAVIDENGLLTAQNAGKVVVTAVDSENAELKDEKTIIITGEDSVTKYDDAEAGITYSGDGWESWGDYRYYQGTGHEIMGNDANAEASFSFTFDGTGIALYGMKLVYHSGNRSAGALVDIIIDGEEVATVDTLQESGAEAAAQQKWFEELNLAPGTHTMEVKLAGLSETAISQGATKPKIAFDYYEVITALDYTALNAAVEAYRAKTLSDYTEETASAATTLYESVVANYENYENQDAVDQAAADLNAAIAALLTPNGAHYYSFEEEDGATIVNDKWGERDSVTNNGTFEEGYLGNAIRLTAENNVTFDENTTLIDNWTVEYWVKLDTNPTSKSSVMKTTSTASNLVGFNIRRAEADRNETGLALKNDSGNADNYSLGAYQDTTTWTHHVWTMDENAGLKFYRNGEYIAVCDWLTGDGRVAYAPIDVFGDTGFEGLLDEVKIYDYALTEDQVQASMSRDVAKNRLQTAVDAAEEILIFNLEDAGDMVNATIESANEVLDNPNVSLDAIQIAYNTLNNAVASAVVIPRDNEGNQGYTVTVVGGTIEACKDETLVIESATDGTPTYVSGVTYNDWVLITPNASEAESFVGWAINGQIISTRTEYKFYVPNNVTLTAVYGANEEEAVNSAAMTNIRVLPLDKNDTTDENKLANNVKVQFVAQLNVKEGYVVETAGVAYQANGTVANGTPAGLTDGTKHLEATAINGSNQFSITLKGLPKTSYMTAMVYAKLVNQDNSEDFVWVYSPIMKVQGSATTE